MKVIKSDQNKEEQNSETDPSAEGVKLIFTAVCNQIIAKKYNWPFYTILQNPGERIIFFAVK